MSVLLSPLFIAALAGMLWYLRKNKLLVFSILFYVINLLLVLQIIAIGNTIVSDRYTYVPYIGLSFFLGMMLSESKNKNILGWIVFSAIAVVFGTITFQRTQVWKDSGTLWTDVISHYSYPPVPRTNRANYNCKIVEKLSEGAVRDSLLQLSLADCNVALKTDPRHAKGYENRGLIFLHLNLSKEALADGDSLIKLDPKNKLGYTIHGTAYQRLNEPEKAMADFTKSIELFPDDDFSYGKRGTILYNQYQKYSEALEDFNKAISIRPTGQYYINRSYCYYRLGDTAKAKESVRSALQMGESVSADYKKSLGL